MSTCATCGKVIPEPHVAYGINPAALCNCCVHDRRPITTVMNKKLLPTSGSNLTITPPARTERPMNYLKLRNGFRVRLDGSEEPTYGEYVTRADYEELERRLREAEAVMNMLLLCGEDEGHGLHGATKLRALLDGLIVQRHRAEVAERPGMVPVPREPTMGMLLAGSTCIGPGTNAARAAYKAMLAAAPDSGGKWEG